MSDPQFPKETLYNVGVKAVILRQDHRILLLNITRKNSTDAYWDLPGGRIADGETPEQTLRREVAEETGITDFVIERHLGMAMSGVQLPIFSEKKVGIVFSVYVCRSDSEKEEPEPNITMHWCTLEEAAANLGGNTDWPKELIHKIAEL